jgi:hypothetical protein
MAEIREAQRNWFDLLTLSIHLKIHLELEDWNTGESTGPDF